MLLLLAVIHNQLYSGGGNCDKRHQWKLGEGKDVGQQILIPTEKLHLMLLQKENIGKKTQDFALSVATKMKLF